MYISKTDIEDRALLNGMPFHQPVNPIDDTSDNFMEAAEEQLIEEHIWNAYQLHEETVVALSDQGILGASDLAWKLISGMGPDDECCHDDEGTFYYREWEIRFYGFQWRFDHQIDNETFWDTDLLPGIAECDLIDNKPLNMINRYGREANLNDLQRAMLDITLLRFTKIITNKAKGQK